MADYTATGLDESSFDVAWAQESACHAPDKKAFTSEMARVLRPGGRIVMAEYVVAADRSPPPTMVPPTMPSSTGSTAGR